MIDNKINCRIEKGYFVKNLIYYQNIKKRSEHYQKKTNNTQSA
jgi:hypothetical protein